MKLFSIFKNNERIPTRFCYYGVEGGKNISPPLTWTNVPSHTKTLALAVIDIHPIANNWIHWLVTNIPITITDFKEGVSGNLDKEIVEHINSYGKIGYGGPQPPKGRGVHNYVISIYALDIALSLPQKIKLTQFQSAIKSHILEEAQLVGTYER